MEIVKFNNEFNDIKLPNFKENELDIFFLICSKIKEKGIEEIELSFYDLINDLEINNHYSRFNKQLDDVKSKLRSSYIQYYNGNKKTELSIFTKFVTDFDNRTLTIKLNEDFYYYFNDLKCKFTKFYFNEYLKLNGTYTKDFFRILKQFSSSKFVIINVDEFRFKCSVPEGYSTSDFNKRVLNPSIKELEKYFINLKVEKVKKGLKVTDLKITWEKENKIKIKEVEVKQEEKDRLKNKFGNSIDFEINKQNNDVVEIIEYLNKKAEKNFKANSIKTNKVIIARLNEGYSIEDFKKVVDTKCKEWLGCEKMDKFLRPETLFGNKFENYLNEKENTKFSKKSKTTKLLIETNKKEINEKELPENCNSLWGILNEV